MDNNKVKMDEQAISPIVRSADSESRRDDIGSPITVIRPPDAPMAPISETICLADMTQVERERFADKLGCKKFKSHVSDCNKRGLYELAKRDICKEAKEAREKEEQEKSKELETLKARNQVLEQYARKQENDFNNYKDETNQKIEKLASILSQLLKK